VKAESFPPGSRARGECCHDDGSAGRFLVELDGCGEHVTDEGGPDSKAPVSVIDGESAEQERRDGIGRTLSECPWARCSIDSGHCDTGVCDNDVAGIGDDPGGGRVAAAVLSGVLAQPFVEQRLAAVELFAVVSARVKQRRPT
jgi:hypothetical protein